MTLTVDLSPELEAQVKHEAAREGLAETELVMKALREWLDQGERRAVGVSVVTGAEASLLQKINEGLPERTWQRYDDLVERRRAETLTPAEHEELIAISDQIEDMNARRMAHLVELARLRGIPLVALMQELGIETPPHV